LYHDLQSEFSEAPNEASALASIGEKANQEGLDPIDVAALTTVVSTVLNLDASVMKR
jgi:hypothetical protein